jgi:hypothetical protein
LLTHTTRVNVDSIYTAFLPLDVQTQYFLRSNEAQNGFVGELLQQGNLTETIKA